MAIMFGCKVSRPFISKTFTHMRQILQNVNFRCRLEIFALDDFGNLTRDMLVCFLVDGHSDFSKGPTPNDAVGDFVIAQFETRHVAQLTLDRVSESALVEGKVDGSAHGELVSMRQ